MNGFIWATVRFYFGMLKIDPSLGEVVLRINFHPLHDIELRLVDHLQLLRTYDWHANQVHGLAYDPAEEVFYVTGKRWNLIFKLKIHEDQIKNPYGEKVGQPPIFTDPSGKTMFLVN